VNTLRACRGEVIPPQKQQNSNNHIQGSVRLG
jgi:hypothetical protein